MNLKSILTQVVVVLIAIVAYNMVVKKLLKIDAYELNYEQD